MMNKFIKQTFLLKLIYLIPGIGILFTSIAYSQEPGHNFYDKAHYSTVFGKEKIYRLYLPDTYFKSKDRFPVVYFFHGYGGRHNKDESAKLDYDRIKQLVNKYNIIMVMWSGNIREDEPRPYNIGRKTDVNFPYQMKEYFLELVSHIDGAYRTKASRNNRGLIGFSMGGFMSFYLAGKYPEKVCAAVNLLGSPEFYIGYPQNPTLYQMRYNFENLRDIRLRFNNSTSDELVFLNNEVHHGALWTGGLHYEYDRIPGKHKIDNPGEIIWFERAVSFVSQAFKAPLPLSKKWSHTDIYDDFNIRGYEVRSDKKEPGFIHLKNVSKQGFTITTRKWLPDGPSLDQCNIRLTTAAVYKPNSNYNISYYDEDGSKDKPEVLKTNGKGRLLLSTNEKGVRAGIWQKGDRPDFIAVDYTIGKNSKFLRVGETNELTLKLWNRGGEVKPVQKLKVTLHTVDSSVKIENNTEMTIHPTTRTYSSPSFKITSTNKPPVDGSPASVRLQVKMETGSEIFGDEIIVPLFYNIPEFDTFSVDDGRLVNDSVFGKGNADGVASPGEEIMVYINGHRARLYTDDPFVEKDKERQIDEFLPSIWADGFSLSSVIKISNKIPPGHDIEFLASYETKNYNTMERKLEWGKIKVKVK